jgi:hypothetical protein
MPVSLSFHPGQISRSRSGSIKRLQEETLRRKGAQASAPQIKMMMSRGNNRDMATPESV